MPKPIVSVAGEAMPAAHLLELPQAGRLALACTIIRRHRVALDALRVRAEAELLAYGAARDRIEELVERLISGLDDFDGDADREPDADAEGSDGVIPRGDSGPFDRFGIPALGYRRPAHLDDECEPSLGWSDVEARRSIPYQGERIDAEHEHDGREPGPDDGPEATAPETYGRGFGPCAAPAASRERLFSSVAVGVLVTFRGGKLAQARAISGEGRAQS